MSAVTTVQVFVPSTLRADCGGAARLVVKLAEDPTLGGLMAELAAQYPRLERRLRDERGVLRRYVNVYVDGTESRQSDGLRTALRDGAEVRIVPSIAGG
jgi:molybdopterin converting factor small subunit